MFGLTSLYGRLADRIITISGYSKTFSITGWRIGHAVETPRYASIIWAMNDLAFVCAPAPLQYCVAVDIQRLVVGFYQELQRLFQCKRVQFCHILQDIGLSPTVPKGDYYVLADVRSLHGRTRKERAIYLYIRKDWSGRYIRFSFAKTDADRNMACERLTKLE